MRNLLVLAVGAAVGSLTPYALAEAAPAQPESTHLQHAAAPGGADVPDAGAAGPAGEVFRGALPDMPGKQLVVVSLRLPAAGGARPHQHPGSVFVYVTKGEARIGVEGQEPKVVRAGQGFFEPMGAIHNVNESIGPEQANAIAIMIVPDGAPLASPVARPPR